MPSSKCYRLLAVVIIKIINHETAQMDWMRIFGGGAQDPSLLLFCFPGDSVSRSCFGLTDIE